MPAVEDKSKTRIKWGSSISIFLIVAISIWIVFRVAFPDIPTLFAGTRPTNLGIRAGQLASCPSTPNCVSSQGQNAEHEIEPLNYRGSAKEAMTHLKQVIQSQPRAKLSAETDNYLYAEFTSPWMGFVDDGEFYLKEGDGVIEVRSASRLGESDLGVNRQRIETIRTQFNQLQGHSTGS